MLNPNIIWRNFTQMNSVLAISMKANAVTPLPDIKMADSMQTTRIKTNTRPKKSIQAPTGWTVQRAVNMVTRTRLMSTTIE
jgi:hypothetical protein